MVQLSRVNVWALGKRGLISGCLLLFMAGCSSTLHTKVMSEATPPAQTPMPPPEPEEASQEANSHAMIQSEETPKPSALDIPVEEPARPVPPPAFPDDTIPEDTVPEDTVADERMATPGDEALDPAEPASEEAPLVADSQAPSSSVPSPPDQQPFNQSPPPIPPYSIEPEMPTLPTIRGVPSEDISVSAQETPSDSLPADRTDGRSEMREPVPEPQEPQRMTEIPPDSSMVDDTPTEPVQPSPPSREGEEMAQVSPSSAAPDPGQTPVEEPLEVLEDIYFEYDRYTLPQQAIPLLQGYALAWGTNRLDNPIVIEGHCDERGTESYNMVLGKRRASAIKDYLVSLGVPHNLLQVVSYGKERPVCTEHTEQCWKSNRRGHFARQ